MLLTYFLFLTLLLCSILIGVGTCHSCQKSYLGTKCKHISNAYAKVMVGKRCRRWNLEWLTKTLWTMKSIYSSYHLLSTYSMPRIEPRNENRSVMSNSL